MKTVRHDRSAGKAERRAKRKHKHRQGKDGPDRLTVAPVGPGTMDAALLRRITQAAERLDPMAAWPEVAPMVLPVLRRVWHPFPPDLEPLRIFVPPGIWTGFGLDFGPAFSHVTGDQVRHWGVDAATVLAAALENLRALTQVEPPRVDRFRYRDVEATVIQGQGWGSALLLVPDVLAPILGTEPRVLLAPVRNTLIALPEQVDPEDVAMVWQGFTDGAHDALEPVALRWTGTTVVADGDRRLGLAN